MRDRPTTDGRRGAIRAGAAIAAAVVAVLLAMFIVGNITQATISPTPTVNLSFLTPRPTPNLTLIAGGTRTPIANPVGTGTATVKPEPTKVTTKAKPTPTR